MLLRNFPIQAIVLVAGAAPQLMPPTPNPSIVGCLKILPHLSENPSLLVPPMRYCSFARECYPPSLGNIPGKGTPRPQHLWSI